MQPDTTATANYQITLDEQTLQRLFTGDRQLVHLLEAILNQVLDAQVSDQLHAQHYERTEERQGYRNGYKSRQLRIRCWAHKMRNILAKVPEEAQAEVKAYLEAVRDAPTPETGRQAAEHALDHFGAIYPSAMRSFSDDLDASLVHLELPLAHRKFVRTTNLIERSFEEERRRTKTLPRFFSEYSGLKLAFTVLWRASQR